MHKTLVYWIKFDRHDPFRISARDFLELMDLIKREVERYQMPFEWLNRDY